VYFDWKSLADIIGWINIPLAILVSIYTAFLFGQAKGRDFWQSPLLILHMLAHSIMAGAAVLILMRAIGVFEITFPLMLEKAFIYATLANLLLMIIEFAVVRHTTDAAKVVEMILRGRYALAFWGGVVVFGNVIPLLLMGITPIGPVHVVAAMMVIVGIYLTERIWIEAPQRISLT
jgi:formate-dependent nitrite reductase membrane component NrfD